MKPEVLKEMVRDWANIKRRQACDILGSPEAGELLADAKKFDLVVDFLTELGHAAQPTAAPTPAVKQGWKLVPVEPTSEMLSAVGKEMSWCNPVGIFRKMLAATPAAPSQPVTLTEAERVKCLVASDCIGTVKMTYDSGPYEITRTSINASRLIDAIIAALREKEKAK